MCFSDKKIADFAKTIPQMGFKMAMMGLKSRNGI